MNAGRVWWGGCGGGVRARSRCAEHLWEMSCACNIKDLVQVREYAAARINKTADENCLVTPAHRSCSYETKPGFRYVSNGIECVTVLL